MNLERKNEIIDLRFNQNKTIPEICKMLGIGKGTVGYYLKGYNKPRKSNTPKVPKIIISKKDKMVNKLKSKGYSLDDYILLCNNALKMKDIYIQIGLPKNLCKEYYSFLNINNTNLILGNPEERKQINFSFIENNEIKNIGSESSIRRWVKRYLIEHNGHQCQICLNTLWMGKPIPLICDHIDGDYKNRLLSNFRVVCGNCDMQLDTYKNKNYGKGNKYDREYRMKNKQYGGSQGWRAKTS